MQTKRHDEWIFVFIAPSKKNQVASHTAWGEHLLEGSSYVCDGNDCVIFENNQHIRVRCSRFVNSKAPLVLPINPDLIMRYDTDFVINNRQKRSINPVINHHLPHLRNPHPHPNLRNQDYHSSLCPYNSDGFAWRFRPIQQRLSPIYGWIFVV